MHTHAHTHTLTHTHTHVNTHTHTRTHTYTQRAPGNTESNNCETEAASQPEALRHEWVVWFALRSSNAINLVWGDFAQPRGCLIYP